jgi:transcriptional regulator with XRE-family HTH domain
LTAKKERGKMDLRKRKKGGNPMFNKRLFRAKVIEKGFTLTQIAAKIGISEATLSRKVTGISDFTRKEIYAIVHILTLERDDVDRIFFADESA